MMPPDPGDRGPPDLASLKRECHRLIEILASRPYGLRLLPGVIQQLKLFIGYKQNRSFKREKKTKT